MNQTLTSAVTKSSPTYDSTLPNKEVKVLPNVITNSSTPSNSSDRSIRRLSDAKSSSCMLKETLNKVEGYSISYELDCKGWCEMPVLFCAYSTLVTHNTLPIDQPIFTCKTFLPASCECGSITDCEIDFSQKAEKEQQLLRLKPGVHSNSWCATNDKIDVYNIVDSIEQYLGFIVKKSKVCGCIWEINNEKGDAMYTLKKNKGLFCPCSKVETKYEIMPVSKESSEGSITKQWSCCCVNKSNPNDCTIIFPKECDWIAKALIISASIWLYKDTFLENSCVF